MVLQEFFSFVLMKFLVNWYMALEIYYVVVKCDGSIAPNS